GSTALRISRPTPIAGRLVLENTTVSGDTVNFVGNGLELVNVTLNGQLVNRGHLKILDIAGIAYDFVLPANSRLENLGTLEQTGDLRANASSAQLINRGRWILLGNNPDFYTSSGVTPTFRNEGYLAYQGSGTATWYYLNFTNRDSLEVRSGTWRFDYGTLTLQDGAYTVASGALLQLNPGTLTLQGLLAATLDGRLLFNAGVVRTLADTSAAPAGPILNFQGNGLEWQGGVFEGDTTLTNQGLLRITGQVRLRTHLVNTGTLAVEATFYGRSPALLENRAGARIEFRGDYHLYRDGGSSYGRMTLQNDGLLTKTAGTGTSTIDACVGGSGQIQGNFNIQCNL
ncbi:MAG: hypothetical protein Q9M35_01120, partial [Rhodothermus sp.]|nr:hypothetical protein [Rhodothermus sp.]